MTRPFRTLLVLLTAASTVHAQRAVHLGVGGGISTPVGKFGRDYRAGPAGQVTLITGSPDSFFGFRIDYTYTSFKRRPSAPDSVAHSVADTKFPALTGSMMTTLPVGRMKPYVMVGGGWYPYREPHETVKGNDFGVSGGAGVAFPFIVGAGFIEGRYHRVYNRTVGQRFVPLTAGIIF